MARRTTLEQRLSTLLQEKGPLDEFQQEEVVQTMATIQSYHETYWTRSFFVLSVFLGFGFVGDAIHQVLFPFQVKHQGLWEPFLSSAALILCETIFGLCLFISGAAVLMRSRTQEKETWKRPLSIVLICCSLFSLYMITSAVSAGHQNGRAWFRADLLWMPVLPTLYCLLIHYVISLLDHTIRGVEKLKTTKYALKAV